MSYETKRSPAHAPQEVLHRYLSGAGDTLPETVENHGMNMQGYTRANIHVDPDSAANPAIKILFWSAKAGKFVDDHSAIAYAGKGPGVPYTVTVDCNGRIMFVAVVSGVGVGEECWIYVSGFKEVRK